MSGEGSYRQIVMTDGTKVMTTAGMAYLTTASGIIEVEETDGGRIGINLDHVVVIFNEDSQVNAGPGFIAKDWRGE